MTPLIFFVSLILLLVGESLILKSISTKRVLEEQLVGKSLQFELGFEEEEVSFAYNAKSNVCLVVNGGICHCVHGSIISVEITFPVTCKVSKSSYWFSIALVDESTALSSTPILIEKKLLKTSNRIRHMLTLVLPLTLDDVSRASILLHSFHLIPANTVHELLIVVPETQVSIIERSLTGHGKYLTFPLRVLSETILFQRPRNVWAQHPYATQMAIKLLIAQVINTDYYLTLDADLILLHPLDITKLIVSVTTEQETAMEEDQAPAKAIYHHEAHTVHPTWWEGSKRLLNVQIPSERQAFGVTPAILSTWGSLLTVSKLHTAIHTQLPPVSKQQSPEEIIVQERQEDQEKMLRYMPQDQLTVAERQRVEALWLESLGRDYLLWSEYTLYRSTLDYYHVFAHIHTPETEEIYLHCHNVWFVEQLPWSVEAAKHNQSCLFSVVQSTTNVSPNFILQQYQQHFE